MRIVKVTDPYYVGVVLGPHIMDFLKKVKIAGVPYEQLVAHLTNTVQFGGEMNELWVALNSDNSAQAFCQWQVLGIPFVGKAHVPYIYKWTKEKGIAELFAKELVNFAAKWKCNYIKFEAYNSALANLFIKVLKKEQVTVIDSGIITCIGAIDWDKRGGE